MAAITAAAGGGNWTAGTTWVGGVAPTAADDAQLNATSGNVTINSGAVCRSLDCTGYTGTLTHTTLIPLTIGDAIAGAGNIALKLVAGMTYTRTGGNEYFIFVSTSATQQTITTGGKTGLAYFSFNGLGGSWIFTDTVNSVGGMILTAGAVNSGNQTLNFNIGFSTNGSLTRSFIMGSSTFTITVASQAWTVSTTTGLTITPNTSTIVLANTTSFFFGGGLTYNNLTLSGAGVATLNGANTFNNLTRTGTAVKTDSLVISTNQTVTGTFTVNGNSATNRMLVNSTVVGIARTFTAAAVSITNVDLQDITGAGAAAPFTGTSLGDCQGNSGITFDTPVAQTHTASVGGNWSDATKWTSRVPLPQDDVVIDTNTTGTLTADMPRLGKSVDFTGFTGIISFSSLATALYGNLTFASGMSLSGAFALTLSGRSAQTLTSAGKTFNQSVFITAPGGTYTLQDNFIANNLQITNGTLTANNFNVTLSNIQFTVNAGTTVNMGSGIWTLSNTGAVTSWNVSTGATINAGTSTIIISTASTNTRTFGGGGKAYNILTYTVAGSTGTLVITGSNTFNAINFSDTANARTLQFTSGTVTTIASGGTFNVSGTVGKLMTINSSTPGTQATLSKASGTVSRDYLSIQDSAAIGGASWFAGANSTNVSNNTGWIFAAAPASSSNFLPFFG